MVGVVLTGQLNDGTSGLLAIKDRGGFTIAQDPVEATMPLSAIRHVKVDKIWLASRYGPSMTFDLNHLQQMPET